ncbi:hypothetical protein GGI10_004170, partial [Coemansia sp. RSA 2530]
MYYYGGNIEHKVTIHYLAKPTKKPATATCVLPPHVSVLKYIAKCLNNTCTFYDSENNKLTPAEDGSLILNSLTVQDDSYHLYILTNSDEDDDEVPTPANASIVKLDNGALTLIARFNHYQSVP